MRFIPLCAAEDSPKTAVSLGEHCLSPERRRRKVELRSPACLRTIEGTPQARQTGVAFFLATSSWRRKKKLPAAGLPPAKLL